MHKYAYATLGLDSEKVGVYYHKSMGIYITKQQAVALDGSTVSCRIQGKQIKQAHIIVGTNGIYLFQDFCDGQQPNSIFPSDYHYRYSWEWDEQVECVKLTNNKGGPTTMSDNKLSISESLKLIDLDDDKYLLRKYGIIDDGEDVTEEGKKILWRIILASNVEEVVKKLKKLEARKKADKKAKKEEE